MAVDMRLGAAVKASTPKELFDLRGVRANVIRGHVKTGDGQKFLFVTKVEGAKLISFTVVLNWMADMKK